MRGPEARTVFHKSRADQGPARGRGRQPPIQARSGRETMVPTHGSPVRGISRAPTALKIDAGTRWRRASRPPETSPGGARCGACTATAPDEGFPLPRRRLVMPAQTFATSQGSPSSSGAVSTLRAWRIPRGKDQPLESSPEEIGSPMAAMGSKIAKARFGGSDRETMRGTPSRKGRCPVEGNGGIGNVVCGFNPAAGFTRSRQRPIPTVGGGQARQEKKPMGATSRRRWQHRRLATDSISGERPWSRTIPGWRTAGGQVSRRVRRLLTRIGFEGSGIAGGQKPSRRGNPEVKPNPGTR